MIHIVVGKDSFETHKKACHLATKRNCMDISRQGSDTHISVSDYYEHDIEFVDEMVNHIFDGRINEIPNSVVIHYI